MDEPVFIGDEVTAAGFRLGGARVFIVDSDSIDAAMEEALALEPCLIVLTAEAAGFLDERLAWRLVRQLQPPVAVIGDLRGRAKAPAMRRAMLKRLGVSS